jgi:nucleotide-binding universal stress UspA family protein
MMVADVLVALEGSAGGERAVMLALDVGQSLGATLTGMAVEDGPGLAEAFLARSAAAAVTARTVALEGEAPAAVRREILRHDLTVLSREASLRFGPGSSDDDGAGEKPVLVAPERAVAAGPAVLVAYDGSAASRRALKSFGASGLARGRAVHVATIGDDGAAAWDTAVDGCELLDALGVPASAHNLATPHTVSRALLEQRARLGASLLVLGAYTRSHLARYLWGHVTQEMLDKTEVPLFLHY